jgi:hypothetical protein
MAGRHDASAAEEEHMRHKLSLATGFAAGYVLGSRAGHERYEQIVRLARGIAENPAIQSAAGMLQAQASQAVDTAKQAVSDKVAQTVGSRDVTDEVAPYPSTVSPSGGSPS